jgi:mycothiol system anti-sigma-R factor
MNDPLQPDRYTCEQAFARVFEYLDRVLVGEELRLVEEHLSICEGCTHHFKFEGDLLQKIREKARVNQAPAGLRKRIEALLDTM